MAASRLTVEPEARTFSFRTISLYRNPERRPIHAATTIV